MTSAEQTMPYDWVVEALNDDNEWVVTAQTNDDWLAKKTAREDFEFNGRENRVRNVVTGKTFNRRVDNA